MLHLKILSADQDDVWMPNKLARIRYLFQNDSTIELILHDMYMCSSEQIERYNYGASVVS